MNQILVIEGGKEFHQVVLGVFAFAFPPRTSPVEKFHDNHLHTGDTFYTMQLRRQVSFECKTMLSLIYWSVNLTSTQRFWLVSPTSATNNIPHMLASNSSR